MANEFRGTGNVRDVPVLKTARVGAEERPVTQLWVFFDEPRQDGRGGMAQVSFNPRHEAAGSAK